MNPEKRAKIESTAERMVAVAYRWLKRFFNAMMEASARYHEAQTERAATKVTGERKNHTKRKATREKSPEVFDRRHL